MIIRQEQPREFPELYQFVKTAFSTARVSDGDEQDFVDRLRAGSAYLPGLALVAEEDGRLAGHIMLTEKRMDTPDGPRAILMVAPLCVALEYRGRGVGGALLREGLRRGRERGYPAAVLMGDPGYYGRHGFREAASFGLRCTDEVPSQYTLAMELAPGALAGRDGSFSFF